MVKNEKPYFPLPNNPPPPPGFPPQSLKPWTDGGFASIQTPTSEDIWTIWPRRTSRKRSRPQFYKPSNPTKPAVAVAGPRRRGRPPKSGFMSRFEHFETVTRDSNQVSSIQLRSLQEQMSSCISSLEITKDQSSLHLNDQMAEHGSQINSYPSPDSLVDGNTNTKKNTSDISVDKIKPKTVQMSSFHAHDIEETLFDISVTEVAGPIGYHERAQSVVDSKILQDVANALQYMAESRTAVDDAKVKSRSFGFNKSLVHTLEAINKKHGNIAQDCLLESDCMRTLVLLGICEVVKDLEKKQLKDLDADSLDGYYTAVRDAENMKVNVQWLRRRLDEIKDACNLSDEAKGLVKERDRRAENIDRQKQEISMRIVELEKLKSEVQDMEKQLALEVVMVEELNKKFSKEMSKMLQFQHANLIDGLI